MPEEKHPVIDSDEIRELYETLKQPILDLGDIELQPKKKYIAFIGSRNIVDIHIQRNALKLWINLYKGDLNDPQNFTRDVANVGHWGNGDYELQIRDDEQIDI